jgi:hypothetical protein
MSYTLKRSNVPMLPKGQPHPEHHLGSAKDPHAIRLFDEPPPDPTGALGADHPQPRMLLWSQELYEAIPNREYGECLYESPFPHSALVLPLLCSITKLLALFYSHFGW